MISRPFRLGAIGVLGLLAATTLFAQDAPQAPPQAATKSDPLAGYMQYHEFVTRAKKLVGTANVRVEALAKTGQDREVLMITVGDDLPRPGLAIVGAVHGPHLAAGEIVLRMAERAATSPDEATKALLAKHTLYFIPFPTPDASAKCWTAPRREVAGNAKPTDDDRDGTIGEDPPEDLNGDGLITMMRVEDEAGRYIPHPDEPRVMIEADPHKREKGRYKLLIEGRDNDQDELWNEDAGDGVEFNRNFPFRFEPFRPGTRSHPATETETRGLLDFLFDRRNVAVVLTVSPNDNLGITWKPNGDRERQAYKTSLLAADAPYVEKLAETYRSLLDVKEPSDAPNEGGNFVEWAYYHYGRFSLASRGWSIPKVPPKAESPPAPDAAKPDATKPEPNKAKPDDRAPAERNALRWFAQEGITGFVEWQLVAHPDFPDKKVEVGGFVPFARLNPPAAKLDELGEKHFAFLVKTIESLPQVRIAEKKVEPLGGGVYRVTVTLRNDGYLPTMPAMGNTNEEAFPLWAEIQLPEKGKLLTGNRKRKVEPLAGVSGSATLTWLVQSPAGTCQMRIAAPAVGQVETALELPAQ